MLRKIAFCLLLAFSFTASQGQTVGFALSGGGARGFAHIGVLKVLEEAGIRPDYITGTSIGALVGGLYAMGYSASEIESLFTYTDWNNYLNDDWNRKDSYIGLKRWAPYGNAFFRLDDNWKPQLPQSVIVGNKVNLELFRLFSPASDTDDFSELPIPFACVATDLTTGQQRVFDKGNLMQAIRASLSIPSLLQPFPLENTLYIDGGISQNLPGKITKDMGADYVIGFKANSGLRTKKGLSGLIHVLDQTVNIGITNNLNEQLSYCNYVIEPDLSHYPASRFSKPEAIIAAGEDYARQHLNDIMAIADSVYPDKILRKPLERTSVPETYKIGRINIIGSTHIHPTKIREYTGLHQNTAYSLDEIIKGMSRAWNSQLFDFIYPVLEKQDDAYTLIINVQERERKYLAMNLAYDRENDFSAAAILTLTNYLMKNSLLMAELRLGGKNELNIDVVKNFGDIYGIYYRLFPYAEEKRIYFYRNHDKVTSARSLEYGLTSGIGIFAGRIMVVEGYAFTCRTNLYREVSVSDAVEKHRQLSGVGFKAYHESLDDYSFPMQGYKALFKSYFSSHDILSDVSVSRYKINLTAHHQLRQDISAMGELQIGSHFGSGSQPSYDPFYLGGMDAFAGFDYYEKSALHYRLYQAGLTWNPWSRYFINPKVQFVLYSDSDSWFSNTTRSVGAVLEMGVKTYLGPVKASIGIADRGNAKFYLSVGYTGDIFHFSRR